MTESKPKIVTVCGPTASGKSQLGVELALKHGGEIVSADSMQIYKGMDIASAKPTQAEMKGVPHHLMSIIDRDKTFSAADYVNLAHKKIREILERGRLPIIVGGTGLYIDSLLNNVNFTEMKSDENYRRELYDYAEKFGNEALYRRLLDKDPEAAELIHMNNLVRVVRALEVIHVSGRKFSELKNESRRVESPYSPIIIGLNAADRSVLYDRINRRVDEMVKMGLVEEARELWLSEPMKTAANAIGYKELIPYFENEASLGECIDKIKQETRRYAKRQLTWFRRNDSIEWVTIDNFSKKCEIFEKSEKAIAKYGII